MPLRLLVLEGVNLCEADFVAQNRDGVVVVGAELRGIVGIGADGEDLAAEIPVKAQDGAGELTVLEFVAPA